MSSGLGVGYHHRSLRVGDPAVQGVQGYSGSARKEPTREAPERYCTPCTGSQGSTPPRTIPTHPSGARDGNPEKGRRRAHRGQRKSRYGPAREEVN